MRIAVTGASGFVGHYLVRHFIGEGHDCRCWYRAASSREGLEGFDGRLEWVPGELGDRQACANLVSGCDGVVHAALYHPGGGFRGGEGEIIDFVEKNVVGTLELIEAARAAGVPRFVFISTCAVHEKILDDRPLDETHPTWSTSHYGAHKATIENFVHSYGWGDGYPICALRPTGVYGIQRPAQRSKWFELVRDIVQGKDVTCQRGGKEVHAADVAKAAGILLTAPNIAGEAYNCYDRYVSEYEVATLAKELSGRRSVIHGARPQPKHQIVTDKLRSLGMQFGGEPLLRKTIEELVTAAANS